MNLLVGYAHSGGFGSAVIQNIDSEICNIDDVSKLEERIKKEMNKTGNIAILNIVKLPIK